MHWATRALCLFLAFTCIYGQFTTSNVNPTGTISELTPSRMFTTLEGKSADPCSKYTSEAYPDCQTVPDSSVTVLIPSASSTGNAMVTSVLAGTYTLSLNTVNLPAYFTTATIMISLGDTDKGCQGRADIAGPDQTTGTLTGTVITFNIPQTWSTVERELENKPRPLCITTGSGYYYTGFKIGVVWNCQYISGVSTCPPPPTGTVKFYSGYQSLTFLQLQERSNRKTCCKTTIGTMNVGQCIFGPADNSQSPTACCGGAQIEVANEQCCNSAIELTAFRTNPCPCTSDTQVCPSGQSCCVPTKYSEFSGLSGVTGFTGFALKGECVGSGYKCCNTGVRYNPGTSQCCSINGVQSVNVPCPCAADSDCQNDADAAAMRCCVQSNTTAPLEAVQMCSKYANFPSGTGAYQQQRCPGSCFDQSYQICCNGIMCIKNYEKCCNNTCCNRWTETCQTGRRAAAVSSRYNWNDFGVKYETCTAVEALFPARAYIAILHPIYCLVMSLVSTTICLIFANKASSRSYAAIEKAMIYIAVLTVILDLVIYFCPAWKYGLFILFVQCVTILTASTRVKKLNIWCLVLTVMLFIYLVDPFHGNQYLTLASSRTSSGQPDRKSAGLIHLVGQMWYSRSSVASPSAFCQWFYLGYFTLDPQLRDTDRYDNPAKMTYGYCDRGYILLLLVFCSAIYVCVFLQLILVLLALLLRFNKPAAKLE